MTFRAAQTVTPDGYIDEGTGEMIYTDFEVQSSAGKESVHRHHALTHQDNFEVSEEDGATYYNNEADNNDYINLMDSVGGQEAYQSMLAWAGNNLSSEDIAEFNSIIDSGDIDYTNAVIQQLAEMYYNQDATDYPEELDETAQYIFNNVIDREDYDQLKDYVRANYDADTIDQINAIFDSGNVEYIRNTIRSIQSNMTSY